MIRVGRRTYNNGRPIDPQFSSFTSIIVMMKSHSKYGELGPYLLKNERGQIIENVYQFSKVYKIVPYSKQRYSRYDNTVIWEHPSEIHINNNNELTKEYYDWRNKGMDNIHPVRYPVGFKNRHSCLFSISNDNMNNRLNYIQARKEIYLKEYSKAVVKQPLFHELKQRLNKGENLLIIEVDGPHQESLDYYKDKYNVNDNFIENDTILINKNNMEILLNDPKHPFGHGYCLAMTLLDLEIT